MFGGRLTDIKRGGDSVYDEGCVEKKAEIWQENSGETRA